MATESSQYQLESLGADSVLPKDRVILLPPSDVMNTLDQLEAEKINITTTILDPWYNKGVGGTRADYFDWLQEVLTKTQRISSHIFLWGFPEIVSHIVVNLPTNLELVAWLTWYYKNCPSVIRGWRSSQLTCLHLSRPGAILYPEHFFNMSQHRLKTEGKLRYIPGPSTVIEAPLLVGFVGRKEQTGHPAQKPIKVIEPLILMTTTENDIVLDPMCGSGTTGVASSKLNRRAILCDQLDEYICMTEQRLGISRSRYRTRQFRAWTYER